MEPGDEARILHGSTLGIELELEFVCMDVFTTCNLLTRPKLYALYKVT